MPPPLGLPARWKMEEIDMARINPGDLSRRVARRRQELGLTQAEVATLLGHLCAGTPDDVVDIAGIDPGPIGERAQYCGAQLLRMDTR